MDAGTETCMLVFLVLLLASIVMQWLRARKRRNLVRRFDTDLLEAIDREKWRAVDQSMDWFFKDFRKLQVIKQYAGRVSHEFKAEFDHYRRFSRAEMTVTASMLLFALTAFLFCN